jgi:hypothetical protein
MARSQPQEQTGCDCLPGIIAPVWLIIMKRLYLTVAISSLIAMSATNIQSAVESQGPLSDTGIRQKIVGTWIVDSHSPSGSSMKGTVIILSDGSLVAKVTIIRKNSEEDFEYEGTWQVKDGFLIETVTRSHSRLAVKGHVTRDKIIRLDTHELAYQTETGRIVTRKRNGPGQPLK